MPQYNLFRKIVLLLTIMLIPIVGLYFYSNQTSTDVLSTELGKSYSNQLIFFQEQVNTNIEMLALWPNLLIHDPDIFSFKDSFLKSEHLNLDAITLVKRIQTKLNIQESSSDWKSHLLIYSPSLSRVVTANDVQSYDSAALKELLKPGWQVNQTGTKDDQRFEFSLFSVSPFSTFHHPEDANLIIEVRFDSGNIVNMLDKFKSDGRRDPFYYRKGSGVIYNRTANKELIEKLIRKLDERQWKDVDNMTIELDEKPYLVNIVTSEKTGWHMIDYIPLSDILLPIQKSNRLFYFSVGCLLLMSFSVAYLLYAQVQVPIKQLMRSFQRLRSGDYAVRLTPKGNNEFSFLFTRFNLMAAQIQELFERVFLEKIRVKEAKLKQLQAQINPHFFYNCFSFVSSMAKLQDYKAVVAMSQNLSSYYRYTTRQERDVVLLAEELAFVTNYLEIQKLRMKRLDYALDLPPLLRKQEVPPLILQPLVENAVIHGIEPNAGAGQIRISGGYGEEGCFLIVEDNGKGMAAAALAALQDKLANPLDEEMGCGLWNVHQRMQLRFGGASGLRLSHSPLGGLQVMLIWNQDAKGSEPHD